MPTGLEKQTAKRATDCGETPMYESKVMAPRNPKLIKGPVEDTKVGFSVVMRMRCVCFSSMVIGLENA